MLPDTIRFPKHTKGFTLIEIMITIAIIGIIAVAAWPSYDRYQQKSRRTDGVNALLKTSAILEKCFTNNSTYAGCSIPSASDRNYYSIAANPALAAESYTLEATPKGAQSADGECGVLRLTHLGVKSNTPTNVAPDPVGDVKRCWSQ